MSKTPLSCTVSSLPQLTFLSGFLDKDANLKAGHFTEPVLIGKSFIKRSAKPHYGRLLVVKWLRDEVSGNRPRHVYAKEVTLQLAANDIANIAHIHSIFLDGLSITGLVLDYYSRGSLRDFLDNVTRNARNQAPGGGWTGHWLYFQRQQMEEVVGGIREVTRALAELHAKLIFHFDLDEQNVMRGDIGWELIDFGGARTSRIFFPAAFLSNYEKESPQDEEIDSHLIRTRRGFGHPDKLPPEAKKKDGSDIVVVDGRKIDAYQWGVVIFNLLFPGFRYGIENESYAVHLEKALRTRPMAARPDHESISKHVGGRADNHWTRDILPNLLEKDPTKRWTIAEFSERLEFMDDDDLVRHMLFR